MTEAPKEILTTAAIAALLPAPHDISTKGRKRIVRGDCLEDQLGERMEAHMRQKDKEAELMGKDSGQRQNAKIH